MIIEQVAFSGCGALPKEELCSWKGPLQKNFLEGLFVTSKRKIELSSLNDAIISSRGDPVT
jgi:hypothetical protein